MSEPAPDFQALFGCAPQHSATAPGRVNLIGEHTDYNGGYVLPTAIPQRTLAELTPRSDDTVRVFSTNIPGLGTPILYTLGQEARRGTWIDFIQGITVMLRQSRHTFTGFDLRLHSTVPLGSGLSSSASMEVAVLRVLRAAFSLPMSDVETALLGQKVENEFVGAPVGIMDQMAVSISDERAALFLDTRAMAFERVPLPPEMELLVINSGVAHNHTSGDYRTRRAECERAASLLGVAQLRDILDVAVLAPLPDLLQRRARHVVTENARVLMAVAALKGGNVAALGALFRASHASMRDDYEVSVPEIDLLVEIAGADRRAHGARLTGGGFGGSIVAVCEPGAGGAVSRSIVTEYQRQTGKKAVVLVPAEGH